MKKIFHLIFPACCFAACNTQTSNTGNDIGSFIKNKVDSSFNKANIPGVFIGVVNNGETLYYGAGYANPDTKTSFDSTTIFEIGSITKTFTAYVLLNILKEKQISDSSSILKYLPDSVQNNKALEGITFLSLMNHTSGLPRLPENLDLEANAMAPYDNYTAELLFEYLETCKPVPDGQSNYSNLGMGLAGVLAERISGKKYEALVNEYVLHPFKMSASSAAGNKSQGYFGSQKAVYWNADVLAPAGTIKSSAKQMLIYLQYMANPTDKAAATIIEKLLQATIALGPQVSVCRAWHTFEGKPVIYWHNGGTYGFSTFAAFVKGQSKAVIVVANEFNKNEVSDELGITIMKELIK